MVQVAVSREELNKRKPELGPIRETPNPPVDFKTPDNRLGIPESPSFSLKDQGSTGGPTNRLMSTSGTTPVEQGTPRLMSTTSSGPGSNRNVPDLPASTGDIDTDLQNALDAYREFLRQNADAYYSEQESMINTSLEEQLTRLEKAYQEAVRQGEMSEEEAMEQFEEQVKAINQHAYQNSQITNLAAEQRGIGSSQQMLAMHQGDQRHTQELRNENVKSRDKRINDIRDRIAQITNEYNLDVNLAETTAELALRQAQAQADQMFNTGMSELNMMQYQAYLQTKQHLTIEEQRHLNILEQMAKQQQYTQDNMHLQQRFTQENMNLQHTLDLDKMKTQHGYDLEKIDIQFNNDLTKMAKQFGYETRLNNQRHSQALGQIRAQRDSAIKQAEAQYKAERQRLYNSYHNKNSQEFKIREAQLKEARDQMIQQIHTNSIVDGMNALGNEHWAWNTWVSDPSSVLNDPNRYFQPNKLSGALKGRNNLPQRDIVTQERAGGNSYLDALKSYTNSNYIFRGL